MRETESPEPVEQSDIAISLHGVITLSVGPSGTQKMDVRRYHNAV